MRIISANLNGVRAAARKGFFDWLPTTNADVVCIQETKAQIHQLEDDPQYFPDGYHCYYYDSTVKKGYSGTAIYSKREPDSVIRGMNHDEFDGEGRYIEAVFGELSVASLYAPSGSSGDHRQESKERYMKHFMAILKDKVSGGRKQIICGDYNIAHKNADIKNWKGNKKNSGFLPHERAWIDEMIADGWVDAFREVCQDEDRFTWWLNRGQARANNVGWRIDYQMITQGLTPVAESVYKDEWYSDHAPLIIDYQESIDDF